MSKRECIELFNCVARNEPVHFEKKVLNTISEYLTETSVENPERMISLIYQRRELATGLFAEAMKYFCQKYNIFSIIFNNKTIFYYE